MSNIIYTMQYRWSKKGRLKAESVIDCEPNKISINNAIQKLYSAEF